MRTLHSSRNHDDGFSMKQRIWLKEGGKGHIKFKHKTIFRTNLWYCNKLEFPQVTWWRHQVETFSALLALCEGNHRSPVDSPRKGQLRGKLMLPLFFCTWTHIWANNRDTGELRRHRTHYNVTVISCFPLFRVEPLEKQLVSIRIVYQLTLKLYTVTKAFQSLIRYCSDANT